MDLGTGTAGVLLALGAALHEEPVHAPLMRTRTPAPVGGGRKPPHLPMRVPMEL